MIKHTAVPLGINHLISVLLGTSIMISACRSINHDKTNSDLMGAGGAGPISSGPNGARLASWDQAQMDLAEPVLKPSEYWRKLDADGSVPGATLSFTTALVQQAFATLGGKNFADVLLASFGPAILDDLPDDVIDSLHAAGHDAQKAATTLAQIAGKLHETVSGKPELLDRFPTMPLANIEQMQSLSMLYGELARKEAPEATPPLAIPYSIPPAANSGWETVNFKNDGCTQPKDEWEVLPVVGNALNLYSGQAIVPNTGTNVSCYHENSEQFAQLLNRLANTVPQNGPIPAEFSTVNATVQSPAGAPHPVTDFPTLLNALAQDGFTVEVYNARMFVDFLGLHYRKAGDAASIRFASWFQVTMGGKPYVFPGEHGEISLFIQKNGKRWAQANWFFGIPNKANPGIATYWRPAHYLRSAWNGYLSEVHENFPPAAASKALPWLTATSTMMFGFNSVYANHHPPLNGYGLFVCGDSVALALQKIWKTHGQPLKPRQTHIFPLVRSQRPNGYELQAELANAIGMTTREMDMTYPPDYILSTDLRFADQRNYRFAAAFPPPPNFQARFAGNFDQDGVQLLDGGSAGKFRTWRPMTQRIPNNSKSRYTNCFCSVERLDTPAGRILRCKLGGTDRRSAQRVVDIDGSHQDFADDGTGVSFCADQNQCRSLFTGSVQEQKCGW